MGDDHDGGLIRDMPLLTRRRMVAVLGLAGAAGMGAWLLGGVPGQAEATVQGAAADGSVCVKAPAETGGPFPADGSNMRDGQTVNVLTESGVVRPDMRASFGDMTGVADGVPLLLEITLVDVAAACAPLAGRAIYVWHADAKGRYSLYDLPEQNYLRAVVVTDAEGRAWVQTIVPGCYDGRWPHIHFEVFAGLEAAVAGQPLLTSQIALPEAGVTEAYRDARYAGSTGNLGRVTLASDNVFSDNTAEQLSAQTAVLTEDGMGGVLGRVTVGLTS